jgi:hypothetical protein
VHPEVPRPLGSRLHHPRILRQPEVILRTEIQNRPGDVVVQDEFIPDASNRDALIGEHRERLATIDPSEIPTSAVSQGGSLLSDKVKNATIKRFGYHDILKL